MPDSKNKFNIFMKTPYQIAGALLLFIIAGILIWTGNANSLDAEAAIPAQIYFEGEYRIGDGPWQIYTAGKHIPSTKGDVTLRGNFHMMTPAGEYIGPLEAGIPIVFYMDHINVTVYEGENEPYVKDCENPIFGPCRCGEEWEAHIFTCDGTEPIELVIHNSHKYGNITAVDELLANVAIWDFVESEKAILEKGELQRSAGILFILISFLLLGTALFSTFSHMMGSRIIWLLGLTVFFAGLHFLYSAAGVSLWSDSTVTNTNMLGISIVFYFLFLSASIVSFFKETKRIGIITTAALSVADAVFFILPLFPDIYFYDTWFYWTLVQTGVSIVLCGCIVKEYISDKTKKRWQYIMMILPLLSFEVDAVMTVLGFWKGAFISKIIFIGLLMVIIIMVLSIVPRRLDAAAKAKELEMEKIALKAQLAESRISTMISQIRPHFIYNTLGSIEQLCEVNPQKAGELVHDFAKYLRGNFVELDNPKPIRISQEMEHVRHYVSIEKVRFPDMTFIFDMKSEDFRLPALTVQPLVENAIKHGLMKLQKGGTVCVKTYETEDSFCISVEDDGMGFDTGILCEEKEHVGIRNIRDRLKAMVNGTLEIESRQGTGTKVLITIPKEVQK